MSDIAKMLSDATVALRTAFAAMDGVAGQAVAAVKQERASHANTLAAADTLAANTLDPNVFATFNVDLANLVNDMNEAANRHAAALAQG